MAGGVIVVAQRWVEGVPGGERFGRPVVEALAIVHEEGTRCTIYSAFYDPALGQDLRTAFHWWNRGVSGMLSSVATHATDLLCHWSLPDGQIVDIKTYIDTLSSLVGQTKKLLTAP